MQDLTLFCNCIPGKDPRHTQFNQINVLCNSYNLNPLVRDYYKKQNFVFDDANENIGYLNRYFGDLTGLYWIWKNADYEYVGTNQYRRFWNDKQLHNAINDKNTLFVYKIDLQKNAAEQYIHFHGVTSLQILYESSKQKKIKIEPHIIESLDKLHFIYGCNMFIGHRIIFDRLCAILFETLFEIYEGSKFVLPYIDYGIYNQSRIIAFLSERIMTLLLENKNHFLGNVDIQFIDVGVL